MAQKTAPAPRRRPGSSAAPGRRKSCPFCKDQASEVDYKNVDQLRRYVSEKGKIRHRASPARAGGTSGWSRPP